MKITYTANVDKNGEFLVIRCYDATSFGLAQSISNFVRRVNIRRKKVIICTNFTIEKNPNSYEIFHVAKVLQENLFEEAYLSINASNDRQRLPIVPINNYASMF